jgi:hypothetical protein
MLQNEFAAKNTVLQTCLSHTIRTLFGSEFPGELRREIAQYLPLSGTIETVADEHSIPGYDEDSSVLTVGDRKVAVQKKTLRKAKPGISKMWISRFALSIFLKAFASDSVRSTWPDVIGIYENRAFPETAISLFLAQDTVTDPTLSLSPDQLKDFIRRFMELVVEAQKHGYAFCLFGISPRIDADGKLNFTVGAGEIGHCDVEKGFTSLMPDHHKQRVAAKEYRIEDTVTFNTVVFEFAFRHGYLFLNSDKWRVLESSKGEAVADFRAELSEEDFIVDDAKNAMDLFSKMLADDWKERITAKEILAHPFLSA